jgi:hypothetical protein
MDQIIEPLLGSPKIKLIVLNPLFEHGYLVTFDLERGIGCIPEKVEPLIEMLAKSELSMKQYLDAIQRKLKIYLTIIINAHLSIGNRF